MAFSEYGEFAIEVAIAISVIAMFDWFASMKLRRVINKHGADQTRILLGAELIAVVLISVCFLLSSVATPSIFIAGAFFFALVTLYLLARCHTLHTVHVHRLEQVGEDGKPLRGVLGNVIASYLIMGAESAMNPEAKKKWDEERSDNPWRTLGEFVSGSGSVAVIRPDSVWPPEHLARIHNRIMLTSTSMVVCAFMTFYLSDLSIEVHRRSPAKPPQGMSSDQEHAETAEA